MLFSSYIRTWRKCLNSSGNASAKEFIFFMVVAYIIPSIVLLYIPKTISTIAPGIIATGFTGKIVSLIFLVIFTLHFLPHFTLQFRRLNKIKQSYWWLLLYYVVAFLILLLIIKFSRNDMLGLLAAGMLLFELIWFGRKSKHCR